METASIIAIQRHRINSDGQGIRTLVILEGCPLYCKYCINPQACGTGKGTMMTTQELYKKIIRDDMYIMAAGGGVTFGGGEPLLWADFIKEFSGEYGYRLDITIETSLNVPHQNLVTLVGKRHYSFIIDIKDLNRHIYEKYTGVSSLIVLRNLEWLVKHTYGCHIRVPHISGYNTDRDVERTKKALSDAFDDILIEEFEYITGSEKYTKEEEYAIGRSTCSILKDIRKEIAKANNIDYHPHDCNSKELCLGHCLYCEQEYEYLREAIIEKGKCNIDSVHITQIYNKDIPSYHDKNATFEKICHHTMGLYEATPKDWRQRQMRENHRNDSSWLMENLYTENTYEFHRERHSFFQGVLFKEKES